MPSTRATLIPPDASAIGRLRRTDRWVDQALRAHRTLLPHHRYPRRAEDSSPPKTHSPTTCATPSPWSPAPEVRTNLAQVGKTDHDAIRRRDHSTGAGPPPRPCRSANGRWWQPV